MEVDGWDNHEWIFLSGIGLTTGGFMMRYLISNWQKLDKFWQIAWAFIGIVLIVFSIGLLIKYFKKLIKEK